MIEDESGRTKFIVWTKNEQSLVAEGNQGTNQHGADPQLSLFD